MSIQLTLDTLDKESNQPLEVLKRAAMHSFEKTSMPSQLIEDKIIAMWALVHGLAAIVIMPNIGNEINWETRVEEIIKSIIVPYEKV